MKKRIERIQERLKEESLDAFLVSNPSNIFYLTEFKGILGEREFLLIISKEGWKLILPRMYSARAPQRNSRITKEREGLFSKAIEGLKDFRKIGFEENDLKYGEYEKLKRGLKGKELFPRSGFCEELREIKSRREMNLIKKATKITDQTFFSILKMIKPGLAEKWLQRKIIEIMEDFGAEGPAFLPIIASGPGSAEPHHLASNKKIKKGEILLLDFGAKYKGYCSDFTRTIYIGKANQKFKKLYNIVLETQKLAIKKCRAGYSIKKLYQEAVSNFKKYKEDKHFIHGLGHGVGIDAHEFPGIGINSKGRFENGMVFTIEPGLYHKNFGGIRIEDLCLIDRGCKVLSKATKKLIEIK
ncbi:MAG: Xaa-Pro peptidase family protein [Patescibacteria group bacterium]|nr:Xaa-Pro peptidase family protein [Patescibacteria group bacterium]